jgi:hypothetical protein
MRATGFCDHRRGAQHRRLFVVIGHPNRRRAQSLLSPASGEQQRRIGRVGGIENSARHLAVWQSGASRCSRWLITASDLATARRKVMELLKNLPRWSPSGMEGRRVRRQTHCLRRQTRFGR